MFVYFCYIIFNWTIALKRVNYYLPFFILYFQFFLNLCYERGFRIFVETFSADSNKNTTRIFSDFLNIKIDNETCLPEPQITTENKKNTCGNTYFWCSVSLLKKYTYRILKMWIYLLNFLPCFYFRIAMFGQMQFLY